MKRLKRLRDSSERIKRERLKTPLINTDEGLQVYKERATRNFEMYKHV